MKLVIPAVLVTNGGDPHVGEVSIDGQLNSKRRVELNLIVGTTVATLKERSDVRALAHWLLDQSRQMVNT